MTGETITTTILEKAAADFHGGEGSESGRNYRATIRRIGKSHDDPGRMAKEAVDLLYSWGGIRKPDALRRRLVARFETWLRENRSHWKIWQSKSIDTLSDRDLLSLLDLVGSLAYPIETVRVGKRHWTLMSATAWGKLLHFVMPNAVVLWDEGQVRESYALYDDPYSFVCYQAYARDYCKTLRRVYPGGLEEWACSHAQIVRKREGASESDDLVEYLESIPKLIDELAYSRSARQIGTTAMGTHPPQWYRFSRR